MYFTAYNCTVERNDEFFEKIDLWMDLLPSVTYAVLCLFRMTAAKSKGPGIDASAHPLYCKIIYQLILILKLSKEGAGRGSLQKSVAI